MNRHSAPRPRVLPPPSLDSQRALRFVNMLATGPVTSWLVDLATSLFHERFQIYVSTLGHHACKWAMHEYVFMNDLNLVCLLITMHPTVSVHPQSIVLPASSNNYHPTRIS